MNTDQERQYSITQNLPTLLRIAGTIAVLISMYSFLVKGWENGNDILRYLMMLGHTGLLAIISLVSGHYLKESKGSRLLLTLSLISVPANFAILGAFIFSQTTAIDTNLYPHFFSWSVNSINETIFTSIGAMAILIPVSWLGFTVLARSMSKKLVYLYIASCLALLIPIREPEWIALLTLLLSVSTLFFSKNISQNQCSAKTQDGILALSLQSLPLFVLTGRSLWIYPMDWYLLSILSLSSIIIFRQITLYLTQDSKIRLFLDNLTLIPITLFGLTFYAALENIDVLNELILPISFMLPAIMLYDLSLRNEKQKKFFRMLSMLVMVTGVTANLILLQNMVSAILSILIGILFILVGFRSRQKQVFSSGILLFAIGMLQQILTLFIHFELSGWISLATIGILAIVVASTLESQGNKMKLQLNAIRDNYSSWN